MLVDNERLKIRPVILAPPGEPEKEATEFVLQDQRAGIWYERSVASLVSEQVSIADVESLIVYMRKTREWASPAQ